MNFSKITYPKCPQCRLLINDLSIFSLQDLRSPNFQVKSCPGCKSKFLLHARIELKAEVVELEEEGSEC